MPPQRPAVLAVSGIKNSGKTTFLAGVIPVLRERGLRIAAIKHDAHDFSPDVPGTDSYRLAAAGAAAVAVYSQRRYMVTEEKTVSLAGLLGRFSAYDLVLIEGAKHSGYPKIEILRKAVSAAPVCDTATLLALCTDGDLKLPGVVTLALDDYAGAGALIIEYLRSRHPGRPR